MRPVCSGRKTGGMLPEGSIPPVFIVPGFPKGCPLWHLLLAKCSVLYLLAWLTETGCGASCAPFAPAGKQAVCSRRAAYRLFCYPGVSKGVPPLAHDLLAKCSVLYLLACWLTETGCGASCAPFAPAPPGKTICLRYAPGRQHTACFIRVSKGCPFGTRLCLQSVVCYTCWRG